MAEERETPSLEPGRQQDCWRAPVGECVVAVAALVDDDAAFGEEFFDVAVGQRVAQVPPHRPHDHVRENRNPANSEAGAGG